MSNTITITGNPTSSPQLSSTRNGKSVTNLTIVDNRRVQVDGEWTDAEPLYQDVTVWGQLAEHVVNHVTTKQLVTVTGRLEVQTYDSNAARPAQGGPRGRERRPGPSVRAQVAAPRQLGRVS